MVLCHMTGVEDLCVMKDNRRLRCGFTTGSCAAAAAAAAAGFLLTGNAPEAVDLMTPGGILLHLPVLRCGTCGEAALFGVAKDAGDDPDVTDGAMICASAELLPAPGHDRKNSRPRRPAGHEHAFLHRCETDIYLDGGEGVGRATKPGLALNIGEAAINEVPRKMIFDAVSSVCEESGYCDLSRAILITITVPEGRKLAEKTFNPRLGIEGGISILGTTGIVEPMSEESLIASIRLEMSMRISSGMKVLLAAPGRYGENFIRDRLHLDTEKAVLCSNFIGKTVDFAVELGADGILFVAHIGKFIKVAGGIMNTHSREADSRAELCAAFALRAGISREAALRILDSRTTDEAVDIMKAEGVLTKAAELIMAAVRSSLQHRCGGKIRTEAILYSTSAGLLGMTDGAGQMLARIRMQEELLPPTS